MSSQHDGDRFGEMWFCEASQAALVDLYLRTAHLEGDIVEIGSWTGRSTVALAQATAPQVLHAVDTWEGSPGEISAQLAQQRDVYATFLSNLEHFNVTNVEVHRMGWRDYFRSRRELVKFCFIDAEHTYKEVADTIGTVGPLMVPGGIITGDDAHHPPVRDAVLDAFPHAKQIATLWFVQL